MAQGKREKARRASLSKRARQREDEDRAILSELVGEMKQLRQWRKHHSDAETDALVGALKARHAAESTFMDAKAHAKQQQQQRHDEEEWKREERGRKREERQRRHRELLRAVYYHR